VSVLTCSACRAARRVSLTWRAAAWMFALLLIAGCGGQSGPVKLDKQLAKDSFTTFLETWKRGETPDSLRQKSAITSRDEDWNAGAKLVSYRVVDIEKDDGSNLHAVVELDLQDPTGEQRTSQVTYVVGTSPVITVFRKD
jgi:hypothetical protein